MPWVDRALLEWPLDSPPIVRSLLDEEFWEFPPTAGTVGLLFGRGFGLFANGWTAIAIAIAAAGPRPWGALNPETAPRIGRLEIPNTDIVKQ